ncbi:MAG: SpoIIIAH-like family protein, partial [Clostridia bacterium]|nr:SpoIIIAH-like family protein [Clostridia bacterium]
FVEMLDKVIQDDNSSEQAVSEATEEKIRLASIVKAEADAEALITAKTGGDCVVTLNNSTAQIVVEKGKLNENSVLQIKDIIMSQADVSESNITISELPG